MCDAEEDGGGPVVGEDGVFEVDRVIDIMWLEPEEDGGCGGPLYRVRWKGFPPIEDTWEPIDNFTLETRKTVRKFVRRYKKMQRAVSVRSVLLNVPYQSSGVFIAFVEEQASGQGDQRHVNVLSREIASIQSMRCDARRQPPLWFYLVVWRGERPEDATWESEVYLRHAGDLIRAYRARHPAVPGPPRRGAGVGGSTPPPPSAAAAPPSGSTAKLLLDAPAPRKQKEKITFLNDLVDDSIRYEQSSSKASRKHGVSPVSGSPEPLVPLENFHKELGESLNSIDSSASYSAKVPAPKSLTSSQKLNKTSRESSKSDRKPQGSNQLNRGKPSGVESSIKATPTPKPSTSNEQGKLKRIEKGNFLDDGALMRKSATPALCTNDNFQVDSSEEDLSSESSIPARSKCRRVAADSDSDAAPDDINSYKHKFIKNPKLEEKNRRKQLMASRKVKPLKQKRTVRRKEVSDRPFSEKKSPFEPKTPNVGEEHGSDEKSSVGYLEDQQMHKKSSYRPRNAHILQKFENIFGYDTDSEDLTLSSVSFCSSGGNSVRKENSELHAAKSPGKTALRCPSDAGPRDASPPLELHCPPTHPTCTASQEDTTAGLLDGLADYEPLGATTPRTAALPPDRLSEGDFVAALEGGNYQAALEYMQCPHNALPRLPYVSMMMDAMEGGRRDVAQLLAAAGLGVAAGGGSEWRALWVPAVELAAKTGDLNMMLVLTQLVRSPVVFSNNHLPTEDLSPPPDRGDVTRALRWAALRSAEDAAQMHVVTALYRNVIF